MRSCTAVDSLSVDQTDHRGTGERPMVDIRYHVWYGEGHTDSTKAGRLSLALSEPNAVITPEHMRCRETTGCPCWTAGAVAEAKARRPSPQTRQVVDYIRAVAETNPRLDERAIADLVARVFGTTERPMTTPDPLRVLRLSGEQMASIEPSLDGEWFVDFDEYEEFVPKELYVALAAQPAPPLTHEPGESHRYRVECEVCGQPGTVQLSVEPQRAALSEPKP